jgi:hypothetical protein
MLKIDRDHEIDNGGLCGFVDCGGLFDDFYLIMAF